MKYLVNCGAGLRLPYVLCYERAHGTRGFYWGGRKGLLPQTFKKRVSSHHLFRLIPIPKQIWS